MKELVYAWYPPAGDVYKSYRETELDTYTKECLYRYRQSRCHDPRRSWSVRDETYGRGERDEPPGNRLDQMALRTSKISLLPQPPSGPSPISVRSKSAAVEGKSDMTSLDQGTRTLQRVYDGSYQSNRVKASSTWVKSTDWLAETSTSPGVLVTDSPAPVSTSLGSALAHQAPQTIPIPVPPSSRLTSNGHAPRVQSAVIRRQGSQVLKRSVQSAGLERPTATLLEPTLSVVEVSANEGQVRRRLRPAGPTPLRWRREEDGEEKEEVEGLGMECPLDFDEQLRKHGWKMEIPGDPLRLKRGCIGKRLPTTVVIPVEEVAQRAGRSHTQSSETFFYNTYPRIPNSFTIHPDWASEILQTKRLELKTKQASNGKRATCRMTDFSFVY